MLQALSSDPQGFLRKAGSHSKADPDLLPCALALAALERPGVSIGRYMHHCTQMAEAVKAAYAGAGGDNPDTMLKALRDVIAGDLGYKGDAEQYDDLQNANLMHVIDRRKGLPITLAILYIQAARAQGWDVRGINFPGHFIARIDAGGQRVLFDPFEDGRALGAHDLRALLKRSAGPGAELSASYLEPSTSRDILIRLQNNLKFRLIAAEDYAAALKIVETMRLIDPLEPRLLLDSGVLYARTQQTRAAITALEAYIASAPPEPDRSEAAQLLQELRYSVN